jgi:HNH endonuclease
MDWKNEELLRENVLNSKTQKDVLVNLNLRAAGGNFKTLRKYLNLYDIDTSHFKKCYYDMNHLNFTKKIPLEEILVENSTYNRGHLKKRLYKEGLKERKCEKCGQGEEWNGEKMSLILDHINGVYNDNIIENLRIVCPNCNATLPTHCSKNIKEIEEKKEKEEKIREKHNHKYTDKQVEKQISKRKVERPTYDKLLIEIKKLGYKGTGRKYGVSDNAIRKWKKFYENYN